MGVDRILSGGAVMTIEVHAEDIQMMETQDYDPDTSYLYQDDLWEEFRERREAAERGDFYWIGVYAHVEVLLPTPDGIVLDGGKTYTRHTLQSPGLWGIESDSDDDYLNEVFQEERAQLIENLKKMGFSIVGECDGD